MPKTKNSLTFEEAHQRAKKARQELDSYLNEGIQCQAKIRKLEREIKELATQEKFEEAAKTASVRNTHKAHAAELDELRTTARKAFEKYSNMARELFFTSEGTAKTLAAPTDVEVTRVCVVDPDTFSSDEAVYLDSCDTIQLDVKGLHFDAEAYHVGEWAAQNFLYVHHVTGKLSL